MWHNSHAVVSRWRDMFQFYLFGPGRTGSDPAGCNESGRMTLSLSIAERIARARTDLRSGVPVILRGDHGAALILSAEVASTTRLSALLATGAVSLAITEKRARTLKARVYDGDLARIELPRDANLDWIHAVADPSKDLTHPMKGPFQSQRDGSPDLHRAAIRLMKSAHLLPAALVCEVGTEVAPPDLTVLNIDDLGDALDTPSHLKRIVASRVPLQVSHQGRVHVFRPDDGGEEHYAVEIGTPNRDAPILARLHSACFTGDVLGSLKCDCGSQLRAALTAMADTGAGVLIYLNQEGRGIGLANKMRAYALQDQGFDTVEANHRLGFEDDERDFRMGAAILRNLGFASARLMTNNPAKVDKLIACGIDVVERVPVAVGRTAENSDYLDVKARKSGHIL